MSEHFADRLSRLIEERGPICAGLDPRKNQMPKNSTEIAWARDVIRTLRDQVAVFKPQIAFWGDSWETLSTLFDLDGCTGDAMILAEVFEDAGALGKLEAFVSENGANFYGLPLSQETITLEREPWIHNNIDFNVSTFWGAREYRWRVAE